MALPPLVVDARRLAADLVSVDLLARLQLAAGRAGREARLRNVSAELRALIAFAGLGEVLRVEPGGQPEEREERRGVEDERDLLDPPA